MAIQPTIAPSIHDEPLVGLYTLFYRSNTGNQMQAKNFRFHGKFQEAVARGQRHCELMGFRFSFVQPLISNLEKEEAFHLGANYKELA